MDCTLTFTDGTHYDLSSLSNAKKDYEMVVGNETYRLNVCRSVVSELWNVENPEDVQAYVSRMGGDFSIGSNSSLHPSPMTLEPLLYMSNGGPCPNDPSASASTVIRFVCDPTVFSAGAPTLIAALPPGPPDQHCSFFMEWRTHVACPTNKPASVGSLGHWSYIGVFFAFLFVAGLAYLVFSTCYNRFVLGYRGMDQLPRPALPSLHMPDIRSLFRREPRSGPSFGAWRRGGYGQVGAVDSDDDEDQHLAGRFSLDDEDEGDQDARALAGDPSVWRDARSGNANAQGQARRKGSDPLLQL